MIIAFILLANEPDQTHIIPRRATAAFKDAIMIDKPASVPVYSLAERDRRWRLARQFMTQQGVDGLIVFGEHEDAGAAQFAFDAWFTNDRPGSTVIITHDADPIELVPYSLFILGHMEALHRGDAVWIAADHIRVGRDAAAVIDTLEERHLQRATIGVVGLEPYMPWHPEGLIPFHLWDKVLSAFPDAVFKPVMEPFIRLLLPQGEEEIAAFRQSAAIGEAMCEAMVAAARPGVSEAGVYAAGVATACSQGTVVPGMHFYTSPAPINWGPPPWAYRPQAPRVLQDGDVLAMEVFASFGMKSTQHQLAITVGEPHPDTVRAAAVARESYEAGLCAMRPGVTFDAVCKAMRAPVERVGGWVRGPQVHSLNPLYAICGFAGDVSQIEGADRYPHIKGVDTIMGDILLEPGMTFAFEPSCGFGRHAVTLGGAVLMGEEGAIELNPFTAQLHRVN